MNDENRSAGCRFGASSSSWKRIRALVVTYSLLLMLASCADKLILFPTRGAMEANGAEQRFIAWSAGKLEVWTARSPGAHSAEPQAYQLELCGNATRAEMITIWVAHRWRKHPVEVWCLNFPGYGKSSGDATLKSLAPSALATFDELAKHANGKPIFIGGHSIGTTAALYVASRRGVAGVYVHNPPPLRQLILGHYGWWNLWIGACLVSAQIPSDLDSIENARHCRAPAVFVLADADPIVLPKYQQRVLKAYVGEKYVLNLAGADHNDPPEMVAPEELGKAMEWLWGRTIAKMRSFTVERDTEGTPEGSGSSRE